MSKDSLQQFAALRDSLARERDTLQSRLTAINAALGREICCLARIQTRAAKCRLVSTCGVVNFVLETCRVMR